MKKHIGTALAIIVGLLAFAGAKWAVQGGISAFQHSESNVSREFDNYASSDPMMQTFAETYPEDWSEFRSMMIENLRDQSITGSDMGRLAHDHMRAFMLSKTAALIAAPEASMVDMIEADGAFLRYLQSSDLNACAAHAMDGLGPDAALTAEGAALLAASVTQRLRAARAGETNPVARGELTEADTTALTDAMLASGLPESEVNALFDGSVMQASPQVQCDATVGMYDGLSALPADRASRVYAVILEGAAQAAS